MAYELYLKKGGKNRKEKKKPEGKNYLVCKRTKDKSDTEDTGFPLEATQEGENGVTEK